MKTIVVVRVNWDEQLAVSGSAAANKMGNQMDKVLDGLYVGGFLGLYFTFLVCRV
jgi:hypothetical protein